jgi:hypothetical protein
VREKGGSLRNSMAVKVIEPIFERKVIVVVEVPFPDPGLGNLGLLLFSFLACYGKRK